MLIASIVGTKASAARTAIVGTVKTIGSLVRIFIRGSPSLFRHCDDRSDEAIHFGGRRPAAGRLFASLAMTAVRRWSIARPERRSTKRRRTTLPSLRLRFAVGDELLGVIPELVEAALDVRPRAGDQLFKLDAPMIAEIRPFGILPEIDRRDLGGLGQSLAEVGAEFLVE